MLQIDPVSLYLKDRVATLAGKAGMAGMAGKAGNSYQFNGLF